MQNNIQDIIQNINDLPPELIDIIKEYIPKHILVFTNKQNYILYHKEIKSVIPMYENYIRDIIRRDNIFVFEFVLRVNYKRWINIKNYDYKGIIFNNYMSFIQFYCLDNSSDKCKSFMFLFTTENGLCKNQHKKNIIKHIRWKN
jgi:hypothetical protein